MRTQCRLTLSHCLRGHAKGPIGFVWSGSYAAPGTDLHVSANFACTNAPFTLGVKPMGFAFLCQLASTP